VVLKSTTHANKRGVQCVNNSKREAANARNRYRYKFTIGATKIIASAIPRLGHQKIFINFRRQDRKHFVKVR